jgi:hypothetical protein
MKTRTIRCCSKCDKVQARKPYNKAFLIRWVYFVCEKCR